jgi:hypothetical protein
MSDDISIPSPTYRVPRHSRGMDPATRKLALIAACIGGTLLLVVGGWSMLDHHSHGVPVVQADASPMRVKPANPGGLEVAGVNNDIFSGGSDTDVEKLAPPPQTPDPQALRALPAPTPAAARPAERSATERSAAEHSAEHSAAEHSAAISPAREQAAAAIQPAPRPIPVPVARTAVAAALLPARPVDKPAHALAADHPADHGADRKSVVVQLAALTSEPAAKAEWDRMARRWPDLLGSHRPAFTRIDRGGQPLWRVRTGGFDDVAQATAFCEHLRAKGGGCSVADF